MAIQILRQGSKGQDVKRWQDFLIGQGHLRGVADGIFGPLTEKATKALQRKQGLTADGIVGPQTLGAAFTAGFDAGFEDRVDATSNPVLVGESALKPITGETRERLFGHIEFEHAPTPQNPERHNHQPTNSAGAILHFRLRQNSTGANQTDIYGQLVNHDGTLSKGNFVICKHKADNEYPAVAYNASDDEFLVVWQDYRPWPSTDIYGQRVSASGAVSGSEIAVSTGPGSQYHPELAYNAPNKTYFVFWEDWRNSSVSKRDIYGQRIKHTGALEGGNFAISTAQGYQGTPSVASEGQGFLVSFDDTRNKPTTKEDIYAQRVNVAGSLLGKNFAVSDQKAAQGWSSIAYAGKDASFLVVWQDWRNLTAASTDIYGQHVDVKGTLIKPPASDVNFIVSVPAIKK